VFTEWIPDHGLEKWCRNILHSQVRNWILHNMLCFCEQNILYEEIKRRKFWEIKRLDDVIGLLQNKTTYLKESRKITQQIRTHREANF